MSFEHLNALNGTIQRAFARFVKGRKTLPKICWYPSAGNDFRDLLYLGRTYANYQLAAEPDPVFPDLYVHADYFPWGQPEFLDRRLLHLDLTLGAELVHFQ